MTFDYIYNYSLKIRSFSYCFLKYQTEGEKTLLEICSGYVLSMKLQLSDILIPFSFLIEDYIRM